MGVLRRLWPVSLAALLACRTIEDRYELEVLVPGDRSPSRYRIEVEGWTCLTRAGYSIGWYDAGLVDDWTGGGGKDEGAQAEDLGLRWVDLDKAPWRVRSGREAPDAITGTRLLVLLGPRVDELQTLLAAHALAQGVAHVAGSARGSPQRPLEELIDRTADAVERAGSLTEAHDALLSALRELSADLGNAR